MPRKKAPRSKSTLIDESKFLNAKQPGTEQEFKKHLAKLMKLANKRYNAIYLKYKNNPNIKEFSSCRENFQKIKSIIECKGNPTPLTNKFYLEAWISTLSSDVHALNLNPETEEQLNALNEKIQAIETDFNTLVSKKPCLDSEDKSSAKVVHYIDKFQKTWGNNKNLLKGSYYFNFAKTLVENANKKLEANQRTFLEDAKHYFIQSAHFYKQANLLKFEAQTKEEIENLEITLNELVSSVTEKIANSDEIKSTGKRKSADDSNPAKKVKENPSMIAYPKKLRWETVCEQLLKELEQIGIEKYTLTDPSCKAELSRYKASLASNFALDIIEDLSFSNKRLSNTEALDRLEEARKGFSNSIHFYRQAGLISEKEKINQCNELLKSTIEKFNASPIKGTTKNPNASTRKSSFDKPISNRELDLPIHYTRTFFKNLSRPENNVEKVDNQARANSPK